MFLCDNLEIFYFLEIYFSLIIIFSSYTIYSVLGLMGFVFFFSILLFTLEIEFITFNFLIVYIGGVLILFLFYLMMVNTNYLFKKTPLHLTILGLLLILIYGLTKEFNSMIFNLHTFSSHFFFSHSNEWISNIVNYWVNDIWIFSQSLYTTLFPNFILMTFLLLVGMIGPISICLAPKPNLLINTK